MNDTDFRSFSTALLNPELPVPTGWRLSSAANERFNIYRNNVVLGLAAVLEDTFPMTRRLLGEECFAALAVAFVRSSPPRSPVLLEYGGDFPKFLADFPTLASFPYLVDVARLEYAHVLSFNAADTPVPAVAEFKEFADIPDIELADATLTLHPSVQLIRSRYPAYSIWSMQATNEKSDHALTWLPEDMLVVRIDWRVQTILLQGGSGCFIEALLGGASLSVANEAAAECSTLFSLTDSLAQLLREQLLVAIHTPVQQLAAHQRLPS